MQSGHERVLRSTRDTTLTSLRSQQGAHYGVYHRFNCHFACFVFSRLFPQKNIYKEIDRLEAWKIEILNRSIVEEISKIKHLK